MDQKQDIEEQEKEDDKLDVKAIVIAGLILLVIVSAIVFFFSLVGGAIMKLFGFEYDSLFSLFLFFLIPTVCLFPISNIIEILPKVLHSEFSLLTRRQAGVLYVILDTIASMLAYAVTDYCMDSVRASDISIFVVSFVFALYGMRDIVSEKEEAE